MSSRRTKKDSGRHTSDIDDDGSMAAKEKSCATNGGKATSGKGLNYTAIILMGMLILPGIFAAFMQVRVHILCVE